MHPLLTLWLLVLVSALLLSGVFYLAEHYAHIAGNFYVLIGLLIGGYVLYSLVCWVTRRYRERPSS